MLTLLIIIILFISGCAAPVNYAAIERQRNIQECNQIADAAEFTGSVRHRYMAQCVLITGGSGGYAMTPMYSSLRGTQPSAIGQPDPFGPWSYRGPTWEQFNQFYSQPPPKR